MARLPSPLAAALLCTLVGCSATGAIEGRRAEVEEKVARLAQAASEVAGQPQLNGSSRLIDPGVALTQCAWTSERRDDVCNFRLVRLEQLQSPAREAEDGPVDYGWTFWIADATSLVQRGRHPINAYHPEGREPDRGSVQRAYDTFLKTRFVGVVRQGLYNNGRYEAELFLYDLEGEAGLTALGGFTYWGAGMTTRAMGNDARDRLNQGLQAQLAEAELQSSYR